MKILRGQDKLKLPPIGRIVHVSHKVGRGLQTMEHEMLLSQVDLDRLFGMAKKSGVVYGHPVYYATDAGHEHMYLWPYPSQNGEINIRFYPPIVEV